MARSNEDGLGVKMSGITSGKTIEVHEPPSAKAIGLPNDQGREQTDSTSIEGHIVRTRTDATTLGQTDGWSGALSSRGTGFPLLTDPTWQGLLSFVLSFGALLSVLVLVIVLVWDTLRQTIDIQPISVPKNFADDRGFGPDVAARRLQDAIRSAIAREDRPGGTQTKPVPPGSLKNQDVDLYVVLEQRSTVIQKSDFPEITIPGVGASLDSLAVTIQTFLGLGRRSTISGEFTVFQNHLGLVLRDNHRVIFSDDDGGDPNHPEELLNRAAINVLDDTEPKLVPWCIINLAIIGIFKAKTEKSGRRIWHSYCARNRNI
jgi:hypothetical protein